MSHSPTHNFVAVGARLMALDQVRYVLTGGVGYLVNLVAFASLIHVVGVSPYTALVAAFILNTTSNFMLNAFWTFQSRAPLATSLVRYGVVAVGLLVMNYASFHVLFAWVGLPSVPAQGLAIVIGLPVGFAASRAWAFRAAGGADTPT